MLDKGLQVHFGQSLAELEGDWLAHLRTLPRNQAEIDDLRLTNPPSNAELFTAAADYLQLTNLGEFRTFYEKGMNQFIPFITTIVAIIFTAMA